MEINYEELCDEVISVLEKNHVWVLSTAWEDHVSSRSMSISQLFDMMTKKNDLLASLCQRNLPKQLAREKARGSTS